jgi:hypothetical protein
MMIQLNHNINLIHKFLHIGVLHIINLERLRRPKLSRQQTLHLANSSKRPFPNTTSNSFIKGFIIGFFDLYELGFVEFYPGN